MAINAFFDIMYGLKMYVYCIYKIYISFTELYFQEAVTGEI